MSLRKSYCAALFAAATLGICATTLVAEPATQPAQMQMPSQEEMAKIMEEAGKLVPEHDVLKKLEGKFEATVKEYNTPGGTPTESRGICENKLMFGGRYLHAHFKGNMMGKPYEGVQVIGYDKQKKQYSSVWMDNISTEMMTSFGPGNASQITFDGECICPLNNQPMKLHMELKIESSEKHHFTMTMPGPDGKPMTAMEISYTRVK